jgi:hypothetical protein
MPFFGMTHKVYYCYAEKQRAAGDHKIAEGDTKQLKDQFADEDEADRQQKGGYHRLGYDFVFLLFVEAFRQRHKYRQHPDCVNRHEQRYER